MKILWIALKDLRRSFRSGFIFVMMFILPLGITWLFSLAFGHDTQPLQVEATRVQVVNQDQQGGNFPAGQGLVTFLEQPELANLVKVTLAQDEASARKAVDTQQAGVALIIPPDFSQNMSQLTSEAKTNIVLYHDPTLQFGPSLVRQLVNHYTDTLSGARIAAYVAAQQSAARGQALAAPALTALALQFLSLSATHQVQDTFSLSTPEATQQTRSVVEIISALVMISMMLFFVFYTGANAANSIIRESDEGTLARLFTTPTQRTVILGGKFLSVLLVLIIQVSVLLLSSALLFHISWGGPLQVGLMALGTIVAATGFGIFILSFVRTARQSSAVVGASLMLTSLAGGLFTIGTGTVSELFATINLLVPQGWALKGWKLAQGGSAVADVALPALVLVAFGTIFFAIGASVFRKRFA